MSAYGIPISELKEIADLGNSMGEGGNVINLSDMGGDDLGMGLLSNINLSRNDGPATTVSVSAPPPLASDINITPLEPLDMMNIDIPLAGDNLEPLGGSGLPNITINRDPPPLFGSDSNISQPHLGLTSGSMMDPEAEKK